MSTIFKRGGLLLMRVPVDGVMQERECVVLRSDVDIGMLAYRLPMQLLPRPVTNDNEELVETVDGNFAIYTRTA